MNIKGCLSKKSDDWKTPENIYYYFVKYNGMKDCFKYKSDYDEFKKNYDHENLYVNPPFSKMNKVADWIEKQYKENYCNIYLLIPARTDTRYFHKLLKLKPQIVFIKGRLRYNESKPAPFPTILMIFDHKNDLNIYSAVEQERFNI